MSNSTISFTINEVHGHLISVHLERGWPRQWIGICSCQKGIRCNSRAEVNSFFRKEGCM